MGHKLFALAIASLAGLLGYGQDTTSITKPFTRFDLAASLDFQNFALPLYDVKSNFTHPGLYSGLETNLNKKQNLLLQAGIGIYLNKEMGNGFFIMDQVTYKPHIFNCIHPEIKFGIGWLRSYHPVKAYKFEGGEWVETPGGKSQLIFPIGLGIEYKKKGAQTPIRPFIFYQAIPNLFYDQVLPLSFYTLFEFGVKVVLK